MNILFFDTWTKGIRNFARLTNKLDDNNCTYKLFHIESWGGKGKIDKHTVINNIDCYDISYYNTSYIYDVFKIEMPDVVVILSLSYLLDRTVVSICNNLGIKVVYLAHGKIYMKQGVGNLNADISFFDKIKSRINPKPLMILSNYIRFNCITTHNFSRIIKTLKEFVKHTDSTMFTTFTDEFRVSKGLVYYDEEKEMFEQKRLFPEGMIEAVGNPEMDYIINGKVLDRISFLTQNGLFLDKYVVYLDDGFLQEGIFTTEDWKNFITEIITVLKNKGYKLVIKLHPRTDISGMKSFFCDNNIIALKDIDFKNLLFYSEFTISHSSSTVIYAMILKKAIILPRWGKMSNLIRNYPDSCVYYIDSVKKYNELINNNNKLSAKETNEYLNKNCGVLDGKSIDRIVDRIITVS